MSNTIFTGAGVAIITPMNADGSINYDMLGTLIDYQIDNHTDAIVVCGTTGEASTMTDDEHTECIRYTVDRVNKRVPVIAGTGSNDTEYAVQLSKEAERLGADAVLQVTPYYNKTSQRGAVAHFAAVAKNINIPIILYNVPSRTGMSISLESYKELDKIDNIVAVKEASGNLSLVAKIAAETNLDIYSGNDDQILPVLSLGGKGVISVSSNVMPQQKHDMIQYFLDGNHAKALEMQLKYLELENDLFMDVNPIPVKEAVNLMGYNVGECRLPLIKMTDAQSAVLKASMQKAGIIK